MGYSDLHPDTDSEQIAEAILDYAVDNLPIDVLDPNLGVTYNVRSEGHYFEADVKGRRMIIEVSWADGEPD